MAKGIDTTDLMVYGHEAWIVTNKNEYEEGETVKAVLRWGHNTRPDGFCRADEFDIFYLSEDGEKTQLIPTKGEGDFYNIVFAAPKTGVYNLMAIYDNTYGHDDNDNWYEGVRRNLPLSKTVTNYFQVYSTAFSVGTSTGCLPFYDDSRVSFVLKKWDAEADILHVYLCRDGKPEALVSVTLVYFDGNDYQEKMLLTDKEGEVFFLVNLKGNYCLIYRTGLDESIEGEYEERAVTATFNFVKN